jgi:hypothetical protein
MKFIVNWAKFARCQVGAYSKIYENINENNMFFFVQSLLQIDLELVNKRRQIQRLITCAILTRESSRMVVGEQQQMLQQMNNANADISHFGQGNSLGMESDNLAQTSSNGQQNGKRVEVKIEVEEEETMEAINNVGNHQVEENGIKLEVKFWDLLRN